MDEEPKSNEEGYPDQVRPLSSIEPDSDPGDQVPADTVEPAPEATTETAPEPTPSHANHQPDAGSYAPLAPVQQEPTKPIDRGPGAIVLQWLTYAFWGLTVIALSTLVMITLTFFLVKDASVGNFPLYSMAAVLVLLPISVVCDLFYMKNEPEKKTGASAVVMVIHAVIFAIFAIGSLITVVFSLVTLFISSSSPESTLVVLYGALVIAALFAILFLRTILPNALRKFRIQFVILMVAIVAVICGFGFFGPVMDARLTRNDKLIESNISEVGDSVNSYSSSHNKLPNDLNSVTLTGDAKKLVSDNLVTYKKDTLPSDVVDGYTTYYYQLCVTYKKASSYQSSSYDSSYYRYGNDNGYSTYISAYSHPAGEVCYKVKTADYGYSNPVPLQEKTKSM